MERIDHPILAASLWTAVAFGLLASCSSDETGSGSGAGGPGTTTAGSVCPAQQPSGGECVGIASCTYVDGDCDPGVVSHEQHQCHCDSGAWSCTSFEVTCGSGGGGGAVGGSGAGGSIGGAGGSGAAGGAGGAAATGGSGGAGGS